MNDLVDFKKLAHDLDAQRSLVLAAWAYEVAICSDDARADLFLDLAVLYFQCADFGYATAHNLPEPFTNASLSRALQVLKIARERFGETTEILFWQLYFRSVYFEDKGIEDICQKLAGRKDSLLPFMYLFVQGRIKTRISCVNCCIELGMEPRSEKDM